MKLPSPDLAAAKLRQASAARPALALILGSGFDYLLQELESEVRIAYRDLPGFPKVGVGGHRGEAAIGLLAGGPVIMLAGRVHYYEGHDLSAVTFPVRVLAAYGVRDLLLTNAAGGISAKLNVGDFIVVEDHINLMGANPLRGPSWPGLPRFVDLNGTYDRNLRRLLLRAGRECGMPLRSGVYLAVSGPSYETPAEIRAFGNWGADAIGMSTVPEAIVGRQCGLRVAALSCITNRAAGLSGLPLSHREVLQTAARAQPSARKLIRRFFGLYHPSAATGPAARRRPGRVVPPGAARLKDSD